jgi:hypothetical protein
MSNIGVDAANEIVDRCLMTESRLQMEQYSDELEGLQQKIKGAQQSATQFNMRETILGTPTTDYGMLKSVNDMFDPFYQFWTTADRCEPSVCALYIRLPTATHVEAHDIVHDCSSVCLLRIQAQCYMRSVHMHHSCAKLFRESGSEIVEGAQVL